MYAKSAVIQKALEAKLYEERYWKLLLHMPSNVSEIDDARFFFAPNGASDAKAELVATLEAFYDESHLGDEAPLCRFPARAAWLKERLDLQDLPKVECQEYESLKKRVDPLSVTMVFPSAHINSPASMFGHTFLRLNSSYNSRLLSYAINYAADADPKKENGVLFAIKGSLGAITENTHFCPIMKSSKSIEILKTAIFGSMILILHPKRQNGCLSIYGSLKIQIRITTFLQKTVRTICFGF